MNNNQNKQIMKRFKSLTNRSGLFGVILAFFATSIGVTSCRPDFDLDKRMPEWLGTSIYETLDEGFKNDSTGEEYSFKTFVRLIDDLGQKDILAKTGSKTLFVADDKAFERFFQNCPFTDVNGNKITSYDQLSKAQKNMILNGSMLNNVYQVAMLSSSPGGESSPPILGNCMRRVSAAQVLDTIPVVYAKDMPANNKFWKRLREKSTANGKGIVLLQDGTNKPIIFFVNKFLQSNKIDNDDYDFLFRLGKFSKVGKPAHVPGDASVNGVAIAWPNKKCFNGFLHVMSEVIYLLPNMAEYIATNPESRIYSSILDRFSVPYYVGTARADRDENVRMLINAGLIKNPALEQAMTANGDSVYVKKYLSSRAREGNETARKQQTNLDNMSADKSELLKFDPGWNSFFSSTVSNNTDVALQQDMGLMFVPLDEYIMEWWLDETQGGARLRERYGAAEFKGRHDLSVDEVIKDMSGIPLNVIVELVNNNMQASLVGSVPSKFSSVLNDAQDPFFETKTKEEAMATISDVVMCCNGAVFFTNSIYAPTSYKSVSYPVLVNEKLKIIDWAIREDEQLAYKAYLNSMVATYSFFVPLIDTVPGSQFENKLVWIDPASFYLEKEGGLYKALAFSYGKENPDDEKEPNKVMADVYDYDKATGTFTKTATTLIPGSTSNGENNDTKFIRNRILDLMDYHIIVGDVEDAGTFDADGYSFFRTKGRGTIRFKNSATTGDITGMDVQGGWQFENIGEPENVQLPVKIIQRVDLSKKSLSQGNGRTYIIDRPLLPSRKSVYDIVSDTITYPEFKSFFKLMQDAEIFATQSNKNNIGSAQCISTFNTYHYTVYIPKNSGVDALLANKTLMTKKELNSINTEYKDILDDIKLEFMDAHPDITDATVIDSLIAPTYRDSLILLSIQLFGVPDTALATSASKPQAAGETESSFAARHGAAPFTTKKLNQLKNFVKYHIQDNSVYAGADFDAGIDDATGLRADKAKYETAFMNSKQQFVKLTVEGGDDITITDNNGNIRTVQKTKTASGKPYYNIMCREYEIKPLTENGTMDEDTYDDFTIETSSYAVVHLIDEPLCSGDIIF